MGCHKILGAWKDGSFAW